MTDAASKVPVVTGKTSTVPAATGAWAPFDTLRREIDRVFESFDMARWDPFSLRMPGFDMAWSTEAERAMAPAIDIALKNNSYEITAELPGLDEKDIEVKLADGVLSIKGEKTGATEDRKGDYVLSERRYGSFMRSFRLPADVDADKIAAAFTKGVLTVTVPKAATAQNNEKKIEVKAA